MVLTDLLQAIHECDNNDLVFNLGHKRAFLFNKSWYPLRATFNRAKEIANEEHELTTDRALVELVYLGLWTKIADIDFNEHLSVALTQDEIISETKSIADVMYKITR